MVMSSFSVPPLGNLPQWPRVGSLHRAHFPRPLPRDRLQPLDNPPRVDSQAATGAHGGVDTRVASLERDIHFLQQQHKETLEKLHGELDGLKRENKGERVYVGLIVRFVFFVSGNYASGA